MGYTSCRTMRQDWHVKRKLYVHFLLCSFSHIQLLAYSYIMVRTMQMKYYGNPIK